MLPPLPCSPSSLLAGGAVAVALASAHAWVTLFLYMFVLGFLWMGYIVADVDDRVYCSSAQSPSLVDLPSAIPGVVERILKGKTYRYDKRLTGAKAVDEEIQEVLDLLIRDYVHYWYAEISDDERFVLNLRKTTSSAIIKIASKVKDMDIIRFFSVNMVDEFIFHIRNFRKAQKRVRIGLSASRSNEDVSQLPNYNEQIISKYFDIEPTHKDICLSEKSERCYLRDLTDILLYLLLPAEDFNNLSTRYIVREIMVCKVIQPVIDMVCDPDYVNRTMAMYLPHASQSFGSFLKSIQSSESLQEMQEIYETITKEVNQLVSMKSTDIASKHQLNRLAFAKRHCEKRIRELGGSLWLQSIGVHSGAYRHGRSQSGGGDGSVSGMSTNHRNEKGPSSTVTSPTASTSVGEVSERQASRKATNGSGKAKEQNFQLKDILANSTALSYFMEFMENDKDVHFLNFWLTVEGFKVSLMCANGEERSAEGSPTKSPQPSTIAEGDALAIYNLYFGESPKEPLPLDKSVQEQIYKAIKSNPGPDVFSVAQKKVYSILDKECFSRFRDSESYVRCVYELDFMDGHPTSDASSDEQDGELNSAVREENEAQVKSKEPDEVKVSFTARISNIEINQENGKSFAVYVINVCRTESTLGKGEGNDVTVQRWTIGRRYSEFHDLHVQLKDRYPDLDSRLELPAKRAFRNMQPSFLETRRHALNYYLQILCSAEFSLRHRDCEPFLLSFFNAHAHVRLKTKRAKSVNFAKASSSANPKSISSRFGDLLTLAGDSGNVHYTPDLEEPPASSSRVNNRERSFSQSAAGLEDFLINANVPGVSATDIYNSNFPLRVMLLLMDEIFVLKDSNKWMRRRVVSLLRQILTQAFGSSINRKIIDLLEWYISEHQVVYYIKMFRETMWPNGILADAQPARSVDDKLKVKIEAKAKLLGNIPDELKRILGGSTCRNGGMRVFELLQHRTLNKRFLYAIMESWLNTMFPENNLDGLFQRMHSTAKSKRGQCKGPYEMA
eukprot:Nk52_evm4s388 gene=Nk52_evmTU4s388